MMDIFDNIEVPDVNEVDYGPLAEVLNHMASKFYQAHSAARIVNEEGFDTSGLLDSIINANAALNAARIEALVVLHTSRRDHGLSMAAEAEEELKRLKGDSGERAARLFGDTVHTFSHEGEVLVFHNPCPPGVLPDFSIRLPSTEGRNLFADVDVTRYFSWEVDADRVKLKICDISRMTGLMFPVRVQVTLTE
jgi:hypothetical protein